MKTILLSFLAFISVATTYAQFSYSFTAVGGAYTANATPTQIIASSTDDNISASTPIGFNFVMGCTTYTTFTASSNGWMGLGGAAFYSEAFNDLEFSTLGPKIAPLWDDLATGSAGNVNYKLTGTAPNRVLTVEWKEMEWRYTATTWAISFQVKLYETTNRIEFVYTRNGNATANLDTPDASIGLQGPTTGQFYSLDGTGPAPNASSVTETSTLSTKPANGQIYRWDNTATFCSGTPTGGTSSASPTTTNCSALTTTLTGTGMSTGCGLSYQWQSSPNNSTWTDIAGATSATYVATNNANTYYRLVTTCSGNGLSANGASTLVSFTGAVPANDLPCNATSMIIGISASGNNGCSSGTSEPTPPSCWINGAINTVWFKVNAPASGTLKIKTTLLSSGTILQNTQIAVYSGTCGAGMTFVACNDDAAICGGYTPLNSELSLTGLTPGVTYYIAVDGYFDQTGQFEILAIDGSSTFPLVPGQDCSVSFPVCNQTMTIGNPGYQSIGGQCDNSGSAASECTSGEANSVWYNIQINTAGTLTFDIIPNDYGNPNPITGQTNTSYITSGDETDYDWVLWKVSGAGSTNCATIMSSGGNSSSACNFSYLGVTGCSTSGNAPGAYGTGFDAAYEVGPAVVAGEQYILAIHNFSNSTSGFSLQFPIVTPILYTPTTTVYWTGGANSTSANTAANWGGCGTPTCGLNAVVTTASSFQPVLTPGTYNVNDITINTGATLTIQTGATLNVCGNFTNNGNLVCQPGSTVVFVGSGTQNITGSFVGVDAFHHLTVTKSTGTVVANNNIDINGNFLTSNTTSIFNSNNKTIKVGGNFTNNNGNSTFTNTGTLGRLEFIGTAAQTYNQGSSQLDLNFVAMSHTGPGVDLLTNMFIKSTTGLLILTQGKINTGAFRVDVNNSAVGAVQPGNVSSYVNGNLYRTLSGAAGAYDFPVGTSTLYERANINFTTATTIPRLQARFDPWGTPALHTNGSSECGTTYNVADENMGFWTINASANPTSGTYNTTLYCLGATNTAGVSAWTVEKSDNGGTTWVLSGTCDPTSTATVVKRNGMNGFSIFAAAQATTPMPVELMGFYGFSTGRQNELHWKTQSESNSSHFVVERSSNGEQFYELGSVPAAGNSTTELAYQLTDENPYFPVSYYRLRQVDLDGNYKYSGVITVETDIEADLSIYAVYPNPTSANCFVEFSSKNLENYTIEVINATGTLVYNESGEMKGGAVKELNSKEWSNGVYLIRITTASGKVVSSRFVKE